MSLIRARTLRPSFIPLLVLAILPIASIVLGVRALLRGPAPALRRWHLVLVLVGALELVWTVFAQAIVGFAIGLQSL